MKAAKMSKISSTNLSELKAVVFDLDGTLVNSAADITACANKMLAALDAPPLAIDAVTAMIGDGMEVLVHRLLVAQFGTAISDDLRHHALELYRASYDNHPTTPAILYPGVVNLLTILHRRGLKIGLCTNKPQKPALNVLADTGISAFFHIVTGGDALAVRKPDGGHLKHVLNELGTITPDRALMIGDGINDVRTARAIGCPVMIYRHGYAHSPVDSLGADGIFDHHDELAALLGNSDDIALTA